MKIYICGKVTGLPYNEVRDKFNKTEQKLKGMGFQTVNPMRIVDSQNTTWKDAMKICIIQLVQCDAIFLLDDYHESKGGMMEYNIAKGLDMKVLSFASNFDYEPRVLTNNTAYPQPLNFQNHIPSCVTKITSESELRTELENSQEQIYSLCRSIELEFNIQATPEDIEKMIPVFAREVADQGMLPIQLKEAKRYFSNWLKMRIKNKQNGQVNNNGKRANGVTEAYKERLAKDLLAECNAGNTTQS